MDYTNAAPPALGDILLCGACGTPSVVTLDGTRPLTDEEFQALTDEEARDLDFAPTLTD